MPKKHLDAALSVGLSTTLETKQGLDNVLSAMPIKNVFCLVVTWDVIFNSLGFIQSLKSRVLRLT